MITVPDFNVYHRHAYMPPSMSRRRINRLVELAWRLGLRVRWRRRRQAKRVGIVWLLDGLQHHEREDLYDLCESAHAGQEWAMESGELWAFTGEYKRDTPVVYLLFRPPGPSRPTTSYPYVDYTNAPEARRQLVMG